MSLRYRHRGIPAKCCGYCLLGQWYESDGCHNHSNYPPLVLSYRRANTRKFRCGARRSCLVTGQITQRISQRDHDGFFALAGKRKLQIASAFDFAAKLAILIRHRMDEIPAMIRERNLYVAADNPRRADVQQLSSDHEAIAPRLRFDLDIDLVGISAVEHLPCSHSAGPRSRHQRLQKTVEEHLDETALLRLLRGSAGCRERRFGDSNRRHGRLRSEEHTSELQSQFHLVCRLLLEKKKQKKHVEHRRKKSIKKKRTS